MFICLGVTYYAVTNFIFATPFWGPIDSMLNNRLQMVYEAAYEYAYINRWTLFGGLFDIPSVDNGYFVMVCDYGYVGVLLLLILVGYMAYLSWKNRNPIYNIVLMSFLLVLFLESTFIINTSLLCNVAIVIWIFKEQIIYKPDEGVKSVYFRHNSNSNYIHLSKRQKQNPG